VLPDLNAGQRPLLILKTCVDGVRTKTPDMKFTICIVQTVVLTGRVALALLAMAMF
jgi:hypothetical protein